MYIIFGIGDTLELLELFECEYESAIVIDMGATDIVRSHSIAQRRLGLGIRETIVVYYEWRWSVESKSKVY